MHDFAPSDRRTERAKSSDFQANASALTGILSHHFTTSENAIKIVIAAYKNTATKLFSRCTKSSKDRSSKSKQAIAGRVIVFLDESHSCCVWFFSVEDGCCCNHVTNLRSFIDFLCGSIANKIFFNKLFNGGV